MFFIKRVYRAAMLCWLIVLPLSAMQQQQMATACAVLKSLSTYKHENNGACSRCNRLLMITSPILSAWFRQAQQADPTVHIAETYRNEKVQNRDFKAGASGVMWGGSAHNYLPSLAFDLFFMVDGKSQRPPSKYKAMLSKLPATIENGSIFPRLVDWTHFQVKDWKSQADNYPHGNVLECPVEKP